MQFGYVCLILPIQLAWGKSALFVVLQIISKWEINKYVFIVFTSRKNIFQVFFSMCLLVISISIFTYSFHICILIGFIMNVVPIFLAKNENWKEGIFCNAVFHFRFSILHVMIIIVSHNFVYRWTCM